MSSTYRHHLDYYRLKYMSAKSPPSFLSVLFYRQSRWLTEMVEMIFQYFATRFLAHVGSISSDKIHLPATDSSLVQPKEIH